MGCWLLFLVALLPRLLYLLVINPPFEGYYWDLTDNLLQHASLGTEGVKSTQYDPLYPLFLTIARLVTGDRLWMVRTLQATVDSIGAVYLYLLADALTGRARVATLSAVLYALYPLLIKHAVGMGEFSLLSTLLIAFCYTITTATAPGRAGIAGIWLGLAILTRTMVFPVAPLTVIVLMLGGRLRSALVFGLATAAIALPLFSRNFLLSGTLWPARSGVNLFIGNSAYSAALLPAHSPDVLTEYADSVVAREEPSLLVETLEHEKARDRLFTTLAWKQMKAYPFQTVRLKIENVAYFFWPRLVPSHVITPDTQVVLGSDGQVRVENSPARPASEEIAYTVPFCLIAAAAMVGLWTRRQQMSRDAILWCIVLTFVVAHAVYFPATRYRVPMEFVLLFYAAVGLNRRFDSSSVNR